MMMKQAEFRHFQDLCNVLGQCLFASEDKPTRFPVLSDEEWSSLLLLAQQHRCLGIVFDELCDKRVLPASVKSKFKPLRLEIMKQNGVLMVGLKKVVESLSTAGISVIPLKGPILSQQLYGDPGARLSGDIDLLVRKDQVARGIECLERLGFRCKFDLSPRQRKAYLEHRTSLPFLHAASLREIDLHWSPVERHFPLTFAFANWYDRSRQFRFGGLEVATLSLEDQLLFLSLHGSKHRWERLIWLCDIAKLLSSTTESERRHAIHHAARHRFKRPVDLAMTLCDQLFETRFCASTDLDPTTNQLARSVVAGFADRVQPTLWSNAIFCAKLTDRTIDQARHMFRVVTQPSSSVIESTELSSKWYYLLQATSLGSKLVDAPWRKKAS